jgi:hypothetical protein
LKIYGHGYRVARKQFRGVAMATKRANESQVTESKPAHGGLPSDAQLEIPPTFVAPPVQSRAQSLPVEQLRWEDFERLCVRLVRREADIEHSQVYGRRGQKQHGIDIFGRHRGATSYSVCQCKRVESFGPAAIREAVNTFLQGKWSKVAIRFVLCFTDSAIPTQHADAIEKQAALLEKRNIRFESWGREIISELLKDKPDLVDDFFGRE